MKSVFKFFIQIGLTDIILMHTKSMSRYYKWLTRLWIVYPNGAPRLCRNCGNDKTTYKVKDYINFTPCEEEHFCTKCKKIVGYWAYGNWEI